MKGYSIQLFDKFDVHKLKDSLCEVTIYIDVDKFIEHANQIINEYAVNMLNFTTGNIIYCGKKYGRSEEEFDKLYNAMKITKNELENMEDNKIIINNGDDYGVDSEYDGEILAIVCHDVI